MQRSISRTIFASMLFLTMLLVQSCKDVFEEDISDSILEIVSPQDNDTTLLVNVAFKFKPVEGATSYHIEIVSPDFDDIQDLVLDSAYQNNEIIVSLSPGQYQWRAKASNFAYSTEWTQPRNLFIDTSSDLSLQNIQLLYPSSGLFTNETVITFSWQNLIVADGYDFKLVEGTDIVTGSLVEESLGLLSSQFTNSTALYEGTFSFGVEAYNDYPSVTGYSQLTFYVDLTSPGIPILTAPINDYDGDTGEQITLDWDRANDLGSIQSPQFDSIYIYSDSLITLHNKVKRTQTSYTTDFSIAGTYYWRVKTFDEAGNSGAFSDARAIEIQ